MREFELSPEDYLMRAIFGKFPDYLRVNGQTLKSAIREALDNLPIRGMKQPNAKTPDDILKRVLIIRFGLENGKIRTLGEIASGFGVSSERIRQYRDIALCRLKRAPCSKNLKRFYT